MRSSSLVKSSETERQSQLYLDGGHVYPFSRDLRRYRVPRESCRSWKGVLEFQQVTRMWGKNYYCDKTEDPPSLNSQGTRAQSETSGGVVCGSV